MIFVDSHCHLFYPGIIEDVENKLNTAIKQDIKYFLSVGTNYKNSCENFDLFKNYNNIFCSFGIHPCDYDTHQKDYDWSLCQDKKVVGFGEIGLDYYYAKDDCEKNNQKELLINMLEIAKTYNLPCIFHVRDAFDDFFNIAKDFNVNGVMHCYTGDIENAKKSLDLGFYISFSGILTFKNSDMLRDVARYTPIDKILLETDCPYLSPIPYRGKPNEPAYMKSTAIFLSEILNKKLDYVAEYTTNNFFNLFDKASR